MAYVMVLEVLHIVVMLSWYCHVSFSACIADPYVALEALEHSLLIGIVHPVKQEQSIEHIAYQCFCSETSHISESR